MLATFTISSTVFATDTPCTDICSCTGVSNEVKQAAGCSGAANISTVIQNIIVAIIAVLGTVAVVFIVMGGINYITSAGDAAKLKKAKDTIVYACIGLIICALAFAIVNFTIGIINGNSGIKKDPSSLTTKTDCEDAGFTWDDPSGPCHN